MKLEMILHEKELAEAVRDYVVKKKFRPLSAVQFNATPTMDLMDNPTGGYGVSAKITVDIP